MLHVRIRCEVFGVRSFHSKGLECGTSIICTVVCHYFKNYVMGWPFISSLLKSCHRRSAYTSKIAGFWLPLYLQLFEVVIDLLILALTSLFLSYVHINKAFHLMKAVRLSLPCWHGKFGLVMLNIYDAGYLKKNLYFFFVGLVILYLTFRNIFVKYIALYSYWIQSFS